MNSYHLHQSSKTKFLNFFRSIFTIRLFENFLIFLLLEKKLIVFRKLIPPNYLYKNCSFRNVTRDGINYKLDISNVVDHFLYYGIKDFCYDSIIDTIKNAKVILDIGANIGSTSLFYASINSKAKIIGFEPHLKTFKRAIENIELNNFKNIELINIGLGEKKETVKLYEVNENNPGMNRIITDDRNFPFSKININTLDFILEDLKISKADFIKIDVEGFEYAVLLGGEKILKSKPIMLIELDNNNLKENYHTSKQLIEFLIASGYSEFHRADNLMKVTIDSNFDNCHYDLIVKC